MHYADRAGVEPATSGLTSRRSPVELTILGGLGRIRTDTLLHAKQALSRPTTSPKLRRRDSNPDLLSNSQVFFR
jgi:hypothetical protein